MREISVATLEAETLLGITSLNFQRKIRSEQRVFMLSRAVYYIRRALRPTAAGGKNYVGNLDNISLVPDALSNSLSIDGISWKTFSNSMEILLRIPCKTTPAGMVDASPVRHTPSP